MVEFLVTAVILSIGLLGLLGLQLTATAQGSNTRMRGTATLIAHLMMDRIASEGGLSAGERYDGKLANTGYKFIDPTSLSAKTSPYAADTISFFDVNGFPIAGVNSLPKPANAIFTATWTRSAGTPNEAGPYNASVEFTVNVEWLEAQGNETKQKYLSVSRNVRI